MAERSKYLGYSTGSDWCKTLRASGGVRAVLLADGQKIDVDDEQAAAVEAVLSIDGDLTPAQASRVLGVSRPMVLRWISQGELVDRPVGSHHRITRASILALSERRAAAGREAMALRERADAGDTEATSAVAAARERATARVAAREARRSGAGRA